mgnify:CR=1 FL=1
MVPDDSAVQGCVIDNLRDSYGEVACGQREGMSERTGILEERLEDGLDESHGFTVSYGLGASGPRPLTQCL